MTHIFLATQDFFRNNKIPLLLLFLTWGLVIFVYWPQMFYWNTNGDLVAGWRIIWADWALHLSQVHAFAYQPIAHVINNNPIYADHPIAYPFATNLISGLLLRAGIDLVTAMVLPSIIFSLALIVALYGFGKQFTDNAAAAVLGIFLFLLSGGLEFYNFYVDLRQNFSWQTLSYPPEHYSLLEEKGYFWKSVLLTSFIPQRSLLMGMPWMLFTLNFLLFHYFNHFKRTSYRSLFIVGLLAGLLAIIHTHSLLILFIICCLLLLSNLKHYQYWLTFALGTSLTALPCLSLILTESTQGFIQWLPGWYAHSSLENESILLFWWRNWGLFFPLVVITLLWQFSPMANHSIKKTRWLVSAFILLFLLANLIRFQPYPWDNTKILLWPTMAFSFLVAQLLSQLWQKGSQFKLPVILLAAFCCLSGFIDLLRSAHIDKQSVSMLKQSDMELGKALRQKSKPTDIILIPNNHLHLASTITGRGVLMGYTGWLWSYNIPYQQRQKDIKTIYQGAASAKALLKQYQVDYVVIDHQAKRDYAANTLWFELNYPKVLTQSQYTIFKTQ